jgi:hypothetical protein
MRASRQSIIAVSVLVFGAPLLYWLWGRELLHIVAAYHVIDVAPSQEWWFTFFSWAVWSIPVAWFGSLVLLWVEVVRKRRRIWLATYAGVPFAVAAIYWVAWEAFIGFIVRPV